MITHDNNIIDFNMLTHIKSWYIMTDLPYIKVWHDYTIIHIHIIVYQHVMMWYHVVMSHFESIMWHSCGKSFNNWIRDEEDVKNLPEFREPSRILRVFQESTWRRRNSDRIPRIFPEFRIKNEKTSQSHNLVSRKQKPVSRKQKPRGRQGNRPDLPG